MEMFNVHRRDILNFDDYMDLKKPGFGGPASAIPYADARGKRTVANPKLSKYQKVVERDPAFGHKHYDSTYKAMTHDLVYKQAGKKPFTYPDPYLTGIPVRDISKVEEGFSQTSFSKFIAEQEELEQEEEFYEEEPVAMDSDEDFDLDQVETLLKSFE